MYELGQRLPCVCFTTKFTHINCFFFFLLMGIPLRRKSADHSFHSHCGFERQFLCKRVQWDGKLWKCLLPSIELWSGKPVCSPVIKTYRCPFAAVWGICTPTSFQRLVGLRRGTKWWTYPISQQFQFFVPPGTYCRDIMEIHRELCTADCLPSFLCIHHSTDTLAGLLRVFSWKRKGDEC